VIEPGKTYRIKGSSQYFARKYGSMNPEITIEEKLDYHTSFSPPCFLFQGRALAEGLPIDGNTYYGHIKGLGEFVHEFEIETTPGKTSSTLNVICMYCGKPMGTKDGKGVSGTTSSICQDCWKKHFPGEDYPKEEDDGETGM